MAKSTGSENRGAATSEVGSTAAGRSNPATFGPDGTDAVSGLKPWRRGDINPKTGLVFWRKRDDGESWITKEALSRYREKNHNCATLFRKNNPERMAELWRTRRLKNPEKYREQARERRKNNPEKFRAHDRNRDKVKRNLWMRIRRAKNRDEINRKTRERKLANLDLVRAKARENYWRLKSEGRLWYKNNHMKYTIAYRAYRKKRRKVDKIFRLSCDIRSRLHRVLKRMGGSKSSRTLEIIGCTTRELMDYVSSKFKPGMTWENHGPSTWHMDHIKPLAKAETVEELHALWHYTNLQPLWWHENLEKSDLMPEEYEARLKLRDI